LRNQTQQNSNIATKQKSNKATEQQSNTGVSNSDLKMPKFISKLFRRKSSSKSEETCNLNGETKKLSKKERKALEKAEKSRTGAFNESVLSTKVANNNNDVSSAGHNDDFIRRKPAFKSSPDIKKSPRVLAPLNDNVNSTNSNAPIIQFDKDAFNNFADFGDENRENHILTAPVSLSYNNIQQFERQQAQKSPQPLLHQFEDPNKPKFSRLSDGQLAVENVVNHSPTSSDFCFSTDVEDQEYNQMRQKSKLDTLMQPENHSRHTGSRPPFNPMAIHSYMDDVSSNDEAQTPKGTDPNRSKHYISDCEDEMLSPVGNKGANGQTNGFSFDDIQSTSHSSKNQSSDSDAFLKNGIPKVISPVSMRKSPKPDRSHNDPIDLANSSPPTSNIQRTDSQTKGRDPPSRDLYPDSSDSEVDVKEDFDPSQARSNPQDQIEYSKTKTPVIENFADFQEPAETKRNLIKGSKSVADPISPISSILEKLNDNRKSRRTRSSGSVKSAPNGDAAYLRQQHQLGKLREALELDRKPSSGRKSSSEHSGSGISNGDVNAVMSAKEKLRRRRKQKLEDGKNKSEDDTGSRHHSRRKHKSRPVSNGQDDDSDGGDNEWLFDEVTGALGPRGIAADLESLGGSSYRSGKSHGNKSTRSHISHRSHKSHRSRRHRSSNDSVDSRHSRTSHYSRKSTRSALSHMSEQSRSVANDLLRLEMQLAMKGAQSVRTESKHDSDGRSVGSSGVRSSSSRISRTSHSVGSRNTTSSSKRSKITITAPPGKLGIILANKSDSKGTVVSGVRTTSVLVGKISPGDRIVAIDGEDVHRMTVSEITTIMARKSEFDRILTVVVAPQRRNNISKVNS